MHLTYMKKENAMTIDVYPTHASYLYQSGPPKVLHF